MITTCTQLYFVFGGIFDFYSQKNFYGLTIWILYAKHYW